MQFTNKITFEQVADGTEAFVDTLFEGNNVEKIMQKMIKESNREKNVGWLPSMRLSEEEVDELRKKQIPKSAQYIVNIYQDYHKKQRKNHYITNLAISKTNGHNHYCSYWIDLLTRKVYIWDSASSGHGGSEFSKFFYDSAYYIFIVLLKWVDKIINVLSTPDESSFQHGGGFLGKDKSLLAQNIYCHTWTLLFLELHLFGYTFAQISCMRGTSPLLPLTVIKLYAQCLLKRMDKKFQKKYEGLKYIWDDKTSSAIKLPEFDGRTQNCAIGAIHTAIESKIFVPLNKCKDILYI